MPNSGFQGQINQCFYGIRKGNLVPLGDDYVSGNLPNPAFWKRFLRDPSCVGPESAHPRVLTTMAVLAPIRPANIYARAAYTKQSERSAKQALPRLTTTPTHPGNEDPSHAPNHSFAPPTTRGHARKAHIPLVALNSLAPFATSSKPTCGYFFSRSTDHKKKQMGIPATDLVKYRYYVK